MTLLWTGPRAQRAALTRLMLGTELFIKHRVQGCRIASSVPPPPPPYPSVVCLYKLDTWYGISVQHAHFVLNCKVLGCLRYVNKAVMLSSAFHSESKPLYAAAVVQSLSRVQLFVTRWTAAHQASHPSLCPELAQTMSTESVMSLSHPLCYMLTFPYIKCLTSWVFRTAISIFSEFNNPT